MNQRAALETLIIFVRENEPEEKPVLRALKWADKRLEVLRRREARRNAKIPDDLKDESLAIPYPEILADFHGTVCRHCGRKKEAQASFCTKCYDRFDPSMQKALWQSFTTNYTFAFCRGVRLLKEMDERRQAQS